jgi:RHS repeat-associated protein
MNVSFKRGQNEANFNFVERRNFGEANGRMYDPIIGRVLSPDNYVQDPSNAQSYNKYSYCLNNPLKYTDPSGEKMQWWHWLLIGLGADLIGGGALSSTVLLTAGTVSSVGIGVAGTVPLMVADPVSTALVAGSTLAGMAGTVAGVTYGTTIANIPNLAILGAIYGDPKQMIKNSFRINNGLFKTDKNKNFFAKLWQFTSRITWEATQTFGGYYFTQGKNVAGMVDRVDYFGGATFAIQENVTNYHGWSGVSLGNYINAKIDGIFDEDVEGGWINGAEGLYWHEYGHTFDSKLYGLSYLLTIGISSAANAEWTEIRANRWANKYGILYGYWEEWPYPKRKIE